MDDQHHRNKFVAIVPAALLLAAVFGHWPYGFYTLMRLVVCGCAIYLAVESKRLGSTAWPWVLGGAAVLFNPVIPVHMHRSDWRIIDFVAAAVLFGFVLWDVRRAYSQP